MLGRNWQTQISIDVASKFWPQNKAKQSPHMLVHIWNKMRTLINFARRGRYLEGKLCIKSRPDNTWPVSNWVRRRRWRCCCWQSAWWWCPPWHTPTTRRPGRSSRRSSTRSTSPTRRRWISSLHQNSNHLLRITVLGSGVQMSSWSRRTMIRCFWKSWGKEKNDLEGRCWRPLIPPWRERSCWSFHRWDKTSLQWIHTKVATLDLLIIR